MNDLISRQEAIEALCTCHSGVHCNHYPCKDIQAIMDLPSAQQWTPVKYRPVTEEEREYWSEILEYEFGDNMMFDCKMPDDGQKILVCSKCGNIWIDTHEDDGGLMGLEENGDWEDIVAWMPLPGPYEEAKDD